LIEAVAVRLLQTRNRDDDIFWRKDGTSFPVEYVDTLLVVEGGENESTKHALFSQFG
jgi:hypothetical protein